MKKKRFSPIALVLAVVLSLSPFFANVSAAETTAGAAAAGSVSVPLFAEPQTLRLPRNSTSFWFRIPAGTKLGSRSSLTLGMTATDTLLENYSTVTLLLGNIQIATASILDIVNNKGGIWTIPIPAERLKTDGTLNELRIVTTQRSILGDCADIDNPANWVRLEQTSRLNLDVLQMGDPVLGQSLQYLFDRVDQNNQTNAEFIFPSGGDNSTRSAMLTMASAAGAAYPAKDTVRFTVSQGQSSGEESNRVYIGLGAQLPQGMTVPSVAEEHGYLSIARNGKYNDLFFFGGSAAGLEKAGAFFTHSQYLAQLSGTTAVLATDLKNVGMGFVKQEDGYYTLSDFGYDTVSLAGAFHQEITYTIKQPQAIRSGGDSYVEIHFRHSTALVADTSLLTVYVNDIAISSIQLSDSNAKGGSVRAQIPADALDRSTINIKVECYNYLGKLDCSKDYYDTAWTVVDKASVVYFEPGDSSISPTVRQLPAFDPDGGNTTPQAILLTPAGASDTVAEVAAALACRAGQNSGAAYRWEYANSLDSTNKEAADILIIGNNSDVVIPPEVAALLSVVPREGGFAISDAAPVSVEALQNKIVIQAVRSPWNFYHKVFVITFPAGMEETLKQFVSERSNLNRLDGSVALVDQNNMVTVLRDVSDGGSAKAPLTVERILGKIVRATGVSRVGLIIIAVLILVIVLLIIRASTNRRRFADAKKKMEITNADAGKPPEQKEDDSDDSDDTCDR